MSSYPRELYEQLRRPFEVWELEWRPTRSGEKNGQPWAVVAPFVQRPAIVNRLNQVCGINGWASETRIVTPAVLPAQGKQPAVPIGHVAVGVGIRVQHSSDPADVEWVWRWDGTGMLEPDPPYFSSSDAGKGDFSLAFKRAAEQLGVGVYLREVKTMFAQFSSEGRYRHKIAGEWRRWNPPALEGQPDFPGELVDRNVPQKGEPPAGQPSADPIQRDLEQKQKQREDENLATEAKNRVGRWMKENGFYAYHLEAILHTTNDLKMRFQTVDQLKSIGSGKDWQVILNIIERSPAKWEQAPKDLAAEYPTSEERVELLRRLMGDVELGAREQVTIQSAISSGWNDAVEWWITELESRKVPA